MTRVTPNEMEAITVTKISVPCQGCSERSAACHGTCPKYMEYKAKLKEQTEQIRKLKEIDIEQDQIIRTRVARVAGGKLRGRKRDGH